MTDVLRTNYNNGEANTDGGTRKRKWYAEKVQRAKGYNNKRSGGASTRSQNRVKKAASVAPDGSGAAEAPPR